MKKVVVTGALLFASVSAAQASSVITDWSMNQSGLAVGNNNSPAPSTGSGTATALGMTNSYNSTTSVNTDDIVATGGSSTGSAGPNAWRVRGQSPGNGWSSQAPIGTQGAEFDVSTAGYQNISVSFDLYFTTQAPAKMQLEYTTDGSDWVNASTLSYTANQAYILTNSSSANTVSGTYFFQTGGQNFYNNITADLSGVTAANNDPLFGIRIVNAATGADDVAYNGTAYNNSSGNWRYQNVEVSGTQVSSVPLPAAGWLLGSGLLGLMGVGRRKKAA
ncbi:MAG: VPLPA-CTERM sorting domain-containing protein [Nevskia sp.]|nr:VPLPA-CTERM sorting domain-containing protein [Nevskia sp.]